MNLSSPDAFLYACDGDAAVLVPMDRAAYYRSIFLDTRISRAANSVEHLPLSALVTSAGPRPAWIFHVAHCGSTLLARALDDPAGEVVLREPLALREAAVGRIVGAGDRSRLTLVAGMCGRRYGSDARALVKANVPVNFVIDDLLADDADAPVILLYFPLADYLAAILRGPNHRAWLRRVTDELRGGIAALVGRFGDSDAERAAALWLAQLRAYAATLDRYPNTRSLDANAFFDSPHAVIVAAAALLGRPVGDAAVDAIVAGPLFATYSKNPAHPYDNATRTALREAAAPAILPELTSARAWVAARLSVYPLPVRLTPSLVGDAPLLL